MEKQHTRILNTQNRLPEGYESQSRIKVIHINLIIKSELHLSGLTVSVIIPFVNKSRKKIGTIQLAKKIREENSLKALYR